MSRYYIMNKDNIVAEFEVVNTAYGVSIQYKNTDIQNLPFKLVNLDKFLESRTIFANKRRLWNMLSEIGINTELELLELTHGVSVADTFWVKDIQEDVVWEDVSPYNNSLQFTFNTLRFTRTPDYATDGNFPKFWKWYNGERYLVKWSTGGAYNIGLEPLSEILFPQIAAAIGFHNYVSYERVDMDYSDIPSVYRAGGIVRDTLKIDGSKMFSSKCKCFTNEDCGLVTARELGFKDIEDIIGFAKEHFLIWEDVCNILLCDALGLNTDRHTGNIGFMFDTDTYEILSVAPMYDNNLSLLCYYDNKINLDEYKSHLKAKCGLTFEALGKKMLEYLPEKREMVKRISESFEFKAPFEIKNDRLQLLSKVVRETAKKILT